MPIRGLSDCADAVGWSWKADGVTSWLCDVDSTQLGRVDGPGNWAWHLYDPTDAEVESFGNAWVGGSDLYRKNAERELLTSALLLRWLSHRDGWTTCPRDGGCLELRRAGMLVAEVSRMDDGRWLQLLVSDRTGEHFRQHRLHRSSAVKAAVVAAVRVSLARNDGLVFEDAKGEVDLGQLARTKAALEGL